MANLITYADFTSIFTIPDSGSSTSNEVCTNLITEKQNDILDELMGYALRKAFLIDVAAVTPKAKWTLLLNGGEYTNNNDELTYFKGVKTMLKYFISAELIRYYSTFSNTGTGEASGKSNNATADFSKYYEFYNSFIDEYRKCYDYLYYMYSNDTDFEDLQHCLKRYANKFGF